MKIFHLALYSLLPLLLFSCGELNKKFSRITESNSRVYFNSRTDQSQMTSYAVLNGGLMIYFVPISNEGGYGFGFNTEDELNSKSVVLPNGSYRVYAFSWDTGKFSGIARCGLGDGGSVVNLTGNTTTIFLAMSTANCAMQTDSAFGLAENSNAGSSSFDTIDLYLCDSFPASCSVSSSSTWYARFSILGGSGTAAANSFVEAPVYSVHGACSSGFTGYVSTGVQIPVGTDILSPPVRLEIFSTSDCSGSPSGSYLFADGLHSYINAATTSNYYVNMPASSSITYLKLFKYF